MHHADGRVVSNVIVQALQGEALTLFGDGPQTRSFCYVDDLIEGFLKMMETDRSVTGPINLGNPTEFTIRELADKTLALTGSTAGLARMPLPSDDPRQRRPDIGKARSVLGWEPAIGLDEGLQRTLDHFPQSHPQACPGTRSAATAVCADTDIQVRRLSPLQNQA